MHADIEEPMRTLVTADPVMHALVHWLACIFSRSCPGMVIHL